MKNLKNNIALFALIIGLFLTASAQAATFTVDRTDNANVSACTAAVNDCTLRGAITAANAAATDDIIDFDPAVFNADTTIALTAGNLLPNIANNGTLTINAPTAIRVTVSGSSAVRVFVINTGATFEVNNLTIADGFIANQTGGGILNNGTLTLTNCNLNNNRNTGNNGGGIFNTGTLTITNCTLSTNQTTGSGGAISNSAAGSTMTINNSTISGNTATGGNGGGIYNGTFGNQPGTVTATLNNSTISGNTAGNSGGGLGSLSVGSIVSLNSTTFSNNSATGGTGGGGVYLANNGTITLNNSIVADSTSGGDCRIINTGTINASYSLIEENLTCVNGTNSNNLTGDPNLGALQNNGGPTQTHALLTGSIAIDKGNSALTTDQRGTTTRPVDSPGIPNAPGGNGSDIGAFEVQTVTAAGVSVSGRITDGKRGVSNAVIYLTDANGNTQMTRTSSFGYYHFDEIEAGQTITIQVSARRYLFSPQVVVVNEEVTNLNFTTQ